MSPLATLAPTMGRSAPASVRVSIVAAALAPTPERPFVVVIAEATDLELDMIEAGWLALGDDNRQGLALSMLERERRERGEA